MTVMGLAVAPQIWQVKRSVWCDRCLSSAGYVLEQVRVDLTGLTTLSSVPGCKRCDDGEE